MRRQAQIELNDITWDHSRGFTPPVASAQRFHKLHPNVEINWVRRFRENFADVPVGYLAAQCNLLTIKASRNQVRLDWKQFTAHPAYASIDMEQTAVRGNVHSLETARMPIRCTEERFSSSLDSPTIGEHTANIVEEFDL